MICQVGIGGRKCSTSWFRVGFLLVDASLHKCIKDFPVSILVTQGRTWSRGDLSTAMLSFVVYLFFPHPDTFAQSPQIRHAIGEREWPLSSRTVNGLFGPYEFLEPYINLWPCVEEAVTTKAPPGQLLQLSFGMVLDLRHSLRHALPPHQLLLQLLPGIVRISPEQSDQIIYFLW